MSNRKTRRRAAALERHPGNKAAPDDVVEVLNDDIATDEALNADHRHRGRNLSAGALPRRQAAEDPAEDIEPLGVAPKTARRLLGVGSTKLYEMIGSGELEIYHLGKSTRITMRSIRRLVENLITTSKVEQRFTSAATAEKRRRRAVATPDRTAAARAAAEEAAAEADA